MNKVETYNRKNILSQIKWLVKMVRYLLGKEFSEGGSIQSIQEGDNISIDNTDPQNPIISSTVGGDTPTLSEVLAEGNNAGEEVIKFEWEIGRPPLIMTLNHQIGKDTITGGFSIRDLSNNKRIDFIGQFDPTGLDLYRSGDNVESDVYEYWEIGYNGSNNSRGLVGSEYFGANYDDNTYVQKKYVDSVVFNYALKKPTIGGTTGQVLTADRFGSYAWKDVEVQTYLQSITGYDEEATQTLKNINGVMTWVTD